MAYLPSCRPLSPKENSNRLSPGVVLRMQYIYSTFTKTCSTHHVLNIIQDVRNTVLSKIDKNNDFQADVQAGVAGLSWRVLGR